MRRRRGGRKVAVDKRVLMATATVISGSFPSSRSATAAIDWFLNQAIDRDAISVGVVGPDGQSRSPRPGDNRRTDLTWVVSVDAGMARLRPSIVSETIKREGGKISKSRA